MTCFITSHLDFAIAPVGTSFQTNDGVVVPTGGFGWSPPVFWNVTLAEFYAALRGRDGKPGGSTSITPADARRHARAAGYVIFGEDD